MEQVIKDIIESASQVRKMKMEFPMYVIHLLRKALEGNPDIQVKDIRGGGNCKWYGTFVIDEPANENGDKGAEYTFTVEKRRTV